MLLLNDVTAGYGDRDILKGITLSIEVGEILAVIGLNGSGKSTLLRTMLGMLPTKKGEIILAGKNLKSWRHRERASLISLLDSKTQLSFSISVSELLDLGALHSFNTQLTDLRHDALLTVGLTGFEKRNLLELSSGEVKRALIAHILCSGAKIILLDEPLANLDWSHQADLIQNLKHWQKTHGTTFVLAIHELDWAVKAASRICVLHQGRILTNGPPEEVLLRDDVREVFAFQSRMDENPFDGSKQLILSRAKKESELFHGFKK